MMHDITIHALSIKDDLFAKFGDDFDHILAAIVSNMNEQQVEEAEITAKMKIKLDMIEVPNPTEKNINGYREALAPTISHNISSTIKIKDEKKGCIPEGYELVPDPTTGKFVLVKIKDGQASMFDKEFQPQGDGPIEADGEFTDDNQPAALPEPQKLLGEAATAELLDDDFDDLESEDEDE